VIDPATSDPLQNRARRRQRRFEQQAPQIPWNINVLVVEDDAADTTLIVSALRRHPNVATASATNAPDLVLQQLNDGYLLPDLILLDIHMPRLDGFGFLKALRQIPAMAVVPVVFLTTSGLGKDVVVARSSSASSYLVKPDSYAELQTRLDEVIKRAVSGVWSK
jgi:two-component system, chemotaxis family, chemotaxis protein CheY